MPVSAGRQRAKEEEMLATHERAANEERSRRAREELESARQAAGLCIHCGERLGPIARRLGAVRHRGCKTFRE